MKPIRKEVAFSTPWFAVVGKTMREGEAPYYSLKLPDYSVIIPVTTEAKVLVVKQYRPALERDTLEFPCGLVDPGETPAEAARRELLEETGYEAGEVESFGPMDPDNGRLSNTLWGVLARGVRRVEGRTPEEGIEVFEWSLDELYRATLDGRFTHALHVACLFLAVLRGELALRRPAELTGY